MASTLTTAVVFLLASIGVAGELRSFEGELCGPCQVTIHLLGDLLCDPTTQARLAEVAVDTVCKRVPEDQREQCVGLAKVLAPAALEWLHANMDANLLCSEAGVCTNADVAVPHRPITSRESSLECALCNMLAEALEKSLDFTKEQFLDKAHKVCSELPEGLHSACNAFVEKQAPTIYKVIEELGAHADLACELTGVCLAGMPQLGPLPMELVAKLLPVSQPLVAGHVLPVGDAKCEYCKIAVIEAHEKLEDPAIQAEVVKYLKKICAKTTAFLPVDECKEYIDAYAPMAFQLILQVLDPDTLCAKIGLCKPEMLLKVSIALKQSQLQRTRSPHRLEGFASRLQAHRQKSQEAI